MTLTISIIAVALIPLMALLPVGITAQDNAIERTTLGQIQQTITGDLQRTEFDQLVLSSAAQDLPLRFFDAQGTEIAETDLDGAPETGIGARTYDVQTLPTYPAPVAGVANHNLVQAEIRIAFNPRGASSAEVFERPHTFTRRFALIARTSN